MNPFRIDDKTLRVVTAVDEAASAATAPRTEREPERNAPPAVEKVATLQEAVARLEAFVREMQRELEFRIDEASGRVVVSVIDSLTGELIRQIPGEEVLRLAARLDAAGLQFLDPRGVRA